MRTRRVAVAILMIVMAAAVVIAAPPARKATGDEAVPVQQSRIGSSPDTAGHTRNW